MAKILIVDDDPDMVEACKSILEMKGHDVAFAYNRVDGMKAVQSFSPQLMMLDVMMEQPDDGLAMAQELKRKGHKFPILMLTSLSKVTGLDYGKDDAVVPVEDFLEKPVRPETLISKVNGLLSKKEKK